jgi:hypothetical protein
MRLLGEDLRVPVWIPDHTREPADEQKAEARSELGNVKG